MALPLQPPKQLTLVLTTAFTNNCEGSVIVKVVVAVHPFTSVPVTVYVVAHKLPNTPTIFWVATQPLPLLFGEMV